MADGSMATRERSEHDQPVRVSVRFTGRHPDLRTPASFASTFGSKCNVQAGEWQSVYDGCERPGDRISFDGYYGEVVEIGLRSVRLVTLDDNLVSIPNNKFLTDIVASANSGVLHQMCVFHFYIGCNEDFEEAKAIVYDAAASSRYVFLDKPIRVDVKEDEFFVLPISQVQNNVPNRGLVLLVTDLDRVEFVDVQ